MRLLDKTGLRREPNIGPQTRKQQNPVKTRMILYMMAKGQIY